MARPAARAKNPTMARQNLTETGKNPTESDMENDGSGTADARPCGAGSEQPPALWK
jgi:hypothetical protein